MAKNSQPRCDTCRFFERLGEQHGSCHRLPPLTPLKRLWVSPVDWCGEHKKPPRKKGKKDGTETYLGRI